MSITVSCECGGRFRARQEYSGRLTKCPKCGRVLTIPVAPQAAVPAPSAPTRIHGLVPTPHGHALPVPGVPVAARTSKRSLSGVRFGNWLYLCLVLALLPLVWSTVQKGTDRDELLVRRFEHAVAKAPPRVAMVVEEIKSDLRINGPIPAGLLMHLPKALYAALPDDRIEGALLARESWTHWVFALLAAGGFFGVALLLLPAPDCRPTRVFLVGVFTGTAGVFLLLVIQFIAGTMRHYYVIPRGIVGLFLLILKFIGMSYDAALDPDSNFFVSCFGFTFGVGLCEELCKALPLLYHYSTRATLSWRGACLWGFLSGIGFGIAEAIMYSSRFYNGISGGDTYVVRYVSCVALHGIWAAAAALFIFRHQKLLQSSHSWYGILGNSAVLVSAPMLLHGLYDTMLKKQMDAAALVVALISFVWLIYLVEHARKAYGEPPRQESDDEQWTYIATPA